MYHTQDHWRRTFPWCSLCNSNSRTRDKTCSPRRAYRNTLETANVDILNYRRSHKCQLECISTILWRNAYVDSEDGNWKRTRLPRSNNLRVIIFQDINFSVREDISTHSKCVMEDIVVTFEKRCGRWKRVENFPLKNELPLIFFLINRIEHV